MATGATRLNGAQITSLVTSPVASGAAGLWWDGNTTGPKWRKADGSDVTLGAGGGSTGNYSFSSNAMDLTGAATATLFTTTATGITIGGTNVTSGYTITAGGASTVTTTTGGLTLTAAGTVNVQNTSGAVVVGNTTGIANYRSGSTGSFDMSAASGVFKTSTGNHTFGSGTWSIAGTAVAITASSVTSGIMSIFDGNSSGFYTTGGNVVLQVNGTSRTYLDSNGAFRSYNGTETLGASANLWAAAWCNVYGTVLGSSITSAATISPTKAVHHITGTTAITTINLPVTSFVGSITFICNTSGLAFNTGGNITTALTTSANNQTVIATYDGTGWYLK